MLYENFKRVVCDKVQAMVGSEMKVTVQDIVKNNNVHLDGITIISPKCNLSPTIYLDYYYSEYKKGMSIDDICVDIVAVYNKNCPLKQLDTTFFTDWNKVKDRIVFKLVNYEANKEMLETTPHFRFLDLAIIFSCLLESNSTGSATITIHNHHLDFWNVGREDLYSVAFENTPKLLKCKIENMADTLRDLVSEEDAEFLGGGMEDALSPSLVPMYILTNELHLNGATCMLYPSVLHKFAYQIGMDLYILPSSVHEVMIIPAYDKDSYDNLSDMVKEANATQLSKQEILSNHAYYYARETLQITSNVVNN